MLWLLVERIAPRRHAARLGGWLLAATTLTVFPFVTWGHADWAPAGISAQFPALDKPASTIVFTAHGDPPLGWLSTFVPREVRVISLTGGFPASPAYDERIQAVIASRPGPYYAMISGTKRDQESERTTQAPAAAPPCGRLARAVHRVRFMVSASYAAKTGYECTRPQPKPAPRVDPAVRNHALFQTGQDNLSRYGLTIIEAGCKEYPAAIGGESFPFRLCPVTRKP
jgi:hypothetical protein